MKVEMNPILDAVEYLDKRLATIDKTPGTWGSLESLELQTLLLLEVRTYLLRPKTHQKNPFEVRSAYIRFIRSHIKDASAESIAVQLARQGNADELPRLLGEFRDQVVVQLGPEEPLSATLPPQHPPKQTVRTRGQRRPSKEPRTPGWGQLANQVARGIPAPPRMSLIMVRGGT
jgi:hypothetical protein